MARPPFENREKIKYPVRIFVELEIIKNLGLKKIREITKKAIKNYENSI